MLLTLAAGSLRSLIDAEDWPEVHGRRLTMFDVPDFAVRHLGLRGLNVPASMLAGWGLEELDDLRDAADKAACPCLVLIEDTPLPFGGPDEESIEAATERIGKLAVAANRLGCNAVSVMVEAEDTEQAFDDAALAIKDVMPSVERHELNVLIAAHDGLTSRPERLTDLIKRIGGFRIGSLPSFGDAARTDDVIETLRKLAPYAGAVHATVCGFTKAGKHKGCDLAKCVEAIKSVGFVNTIAIDYIGNGDPLKDIDAARELLSQAIAADDS